VTFVPIDEERRKRLDFGPAYFIIESTYLVPAGSDIKSLSEVDRPSIRVIGIADTATIRAAARSLKNAKIAAVKSVSEATEMLRTGKADALALTMIRYDRLQPNWPVLGFLMAAFYKPALLLRCQKNVRMPSLMRPHSWKTLRRQESFGAPLTMRVSTTW